MQSNPLHTNRHALGRKTLPTVDTSVLGLRLIDKYFAPDSHLRELTPMFNHMRCNPLWIDFDTPTFSWKKQELFLAPLTFTAPTELVQQFSFLHRFHQGKPLEDYTLSPAEYLAAYQKSAFKKLLCLTALIFEQDVIDNNSWYSTGKSNYDYRQVVLNVFRQKQTPVKLKMLETWINCAGTQGCLNAALLPGQHLGYEKCVAMLETSMQEIGLA